ncbi:hypothetical protein ABH930_000339 [Kitasatospora sp. GAS204A]|uniref:hypothetical protein n=1 Tax=unclassified Kitasatospora TaxID=2633591 RepID=UPI002473D600|nr:hypothetical protein [Kitasatospora sp. GAS204B]MDH6116920.1 hypothetical protein [Kitasatospora sp. GAS204B]
MVLAVPAPPIRAAGSRVTATTYEADITDAVNFLANPPIFEGYQSAAQSIPNTTLTAIGINTTLTDTYTGHDNVTNNSRYTCQLAVPGWYLVIVSLGFVASATGSRLIEIHKNGTAIKLIQSGTDCSHTDINAAIQCTAIIQLVATDYVEGYAYQSSGGALNTNPGNCGMSVIWLHA